MTDSFAPCSRRRVLTALGTGALAGCLDRSGDPANVVGDAVGGRSVSVERAVVRRSVASRHVDSPVHEDVAAPADQQFVVCDVRVEDGSQPDPAAFDVAVDGERVGTGTFPLDPSGADPRTLAVRVPVVAGERAAVVWRRSVADAARWRIPDAEVTKLAAAPSFEVRRFETPDAVRKGEPIDVTVEVANVGDRDGCFLAELGAVVLSDVGEIAVPVPAGESVVHETSLTPSLYTPMTGEKGDPLPVVLDWGTGHREHEVAVERS